MNSTTKRLILLSALTLWCGSAAYRIEPSSDQQPQELHRAEPIEDEEVYEVVDYEEEDREAFGRIIDWLLFDEEVPEEEDEEARGYGYNRYANRHRGVLRMGMPQDLRDEGSFTGRLYGNLKDSCYGMFCKLGLTGLARSFKSLLGMRK